jgi:hypothetical protein
MSPLGQYRNIPIVIALIRVYQTPSRTNPHVGTSDTCARSNIYGIKKYRGSSSGVGSKVGVTIMGSRSVCSSD